MLRVKKNDANGNGQYWQRMDDEQANDANIFRYSIFEWAVAAGFISAEDFDQVLRLNPDYAQWRNEQIAISDSEIIDAPPL